MSTGKQVIIEQIFIGIGSNMGNPSANCKAAINRISELDGVEGVRSSSLYRSAPVGLTEQDWFVNCVIEAETTLPPVTLLKELLAIESSMGRVRKRRWGERIIDLDILLYGNQIIGDEELTIPHPLMHERSFVLIPLEEIAPDIIHPVLDKAIHYIGDMVRDRRVYRIEE